MERVQFQLESTLPELKDLHEKGLFSKQEIDSITRRRTQFESALISKGLKKEDYFKYAEYEINLEKLRKVRWKRLGYDKNPPPPSASLYSIPRRTMYILKRATAKFRGDISTWLAYVEYAGRQGMRKVVTKGLTSALQYHPSSPTLYLLSAYHHLHPGSPFPKSAIPSSSASSLPSTVSETQLDEEQEDQVHFALEGTQPARTTILLGLRLLPKSKQLWGEYVKLELGWVEALRRRWRVLGISNTTQASHTDIGDMTGGEGSFGPEGESARKAILSGQLVQHAIGSALKAIPLPSSAEGSGGEDGVDFRRSLLQTLRTYPSPLRLPLLDLIYDEISAVVSYGGNEDGSAAGQMILVTRKLYDRDYQVGAKDDGGVVLTGVDLVDEIGRIGREIKRLSTSHGVTGFREAAGMWIHRWLEENRDQVDLSRYLLSIFASLVNSKLPTTDRTISLYMASAVEISSDDSEATRTIRKLAKNWPDHLGVQRKFLERLLNVDGSATIPERHSLAKNIVENVSERAAGSDASQQADIQSIWLLWLDWEVKQVSEVVTDSTSVAKIFDSFTKLSTKYRVATLIQPLLLIKQLDWYIGSNPQSTTSAIVQEMHRIVSPAHHSGPAFFSHALDILSHRKPVPEPESIIKIFEMWRVRCLTDAERLEAGTGYMAALVDIGRAGKASQVYEGLRLEARGDVNKLALLESRWNAVLERGGQGIDDE